MKGIITIKITEHGMGIDTDLEDVGFKEKCELMHSLATVLQMDKHDIALFSLIESKGFMDEAADIVHCESDAELEARLRGEGTAHES